MTILASSRSALFAVIAAFSVVACGSAASSVSPLPAPTLGSSPTPSSIPSPSAGLRSPASEQGSPVVDRQVAPLAVLRLRSPGAAALAATGDALWVLTSDTLSRVDPSTNQTTRTVTVTGGQSFLIAGFGSLWVSSFDEELVTRIDPLTGKVLATIPLPRPEGMAASQEGMWVANHRSGTVSMIDPKSDKPVATVLVGSAGIGGPQPLSMVGDRLWVGLGNDRTLVELDPETRTVVRTVHKLNDPCGDIGSSAGLLWISNCGDQRQVDRVDPIGGVSLGPVFVGGYVGSPIGSPDGVWLPINLDAGPGSSGRIVKLSAEGQPDDSIALAGGCEPGPAVVAFGSAWIGCSDGSVLRLAESDLP